MYYSIKEISDTAGISIRMLRHYDKIGLFQPHTKSSAGYRLYTEGELQKLLQILYLKELDFSLEEIKEIIHNPSIDKNKMLKAQEQLLLKKKERLEAIIKALRKSIDLTDGNGTHQHEIFSAFDMAEIERRKQEFEKDICLKFGEETMNECKANHADYTKEDWTILMSKADSLLADIKQMMDLCPSDQKVQEKIGQYRDFITENMWNCTLERFKVLANLYVADRDYRDYIARYHEDFPELLKEAIDYFCK